MQIQINRESPRLLLDSEILEGISIIDIGDFTIAEIFMLRYRTRNTFENSNRSITYTKNCFDYV